MILVLGWCDGPDLHLRRRRACVPRRPAPTSVPGFDALGLALTLYDDLTARVTGEGFRVDRDRRGRRRAARPTPSTWSCGRCWPPSTSWASGRRAWRVRVRQPDPAGPRAGLVVGRDRRPGCNWPARLVTDGPRGSTTPARCALAARDRGPPRQRGAVPARRVHHRLDRGRGRPGRAAGGRLRAYGRRSSSRRSAGYTATARPALPAAVPHADAAFNAGRAALLVHALTTDPACSSRPPRTGCTRATGPRRCRAPRRWSRRCGRSGWRPWSAGPARACWR